MSVSTPVRGASTGVVLVLLAVLYGLVGVATAAADVADDVPVRVDVEDLTAQPDGTTTVTVRVSGIPEGQILQPSDLEIVENGELVADVGVGDVAVVGDTIVPAVVLAIDTSGSLVGEGIVAARDAATQLALDVTESGGLVGVVSFSDDVETLIDLTDDGAAAAAAVGELAAGGGTALYDGISRATRIAASHDGPADVIVFTDGVDNGSQTGLDDVRTLVGDAEMPVTTVRLVSSVEQEAADDNAVDAIAAAGGGTVIRIDDVSELAGTFEAIATDLSNRVTLRWVAEPTAERTALLSVVVSYVDEDGAVVASDGLQVVNPRLVAITPPRPVEVRGPIIQPLATQVGLAIGIGALALAVLLLGIVLFDVTSERRRTAALESRLALYDGGGRSRKGDGGHAQSITERAANVVDIVPRPATLDQRLARRIEQADWPMRVGELLLLVLSIGLLFFLFVLLVVGTPWWLAIGPGLIGAALPFVVLQVAVGQRQRAFADQLPDVLQVIGGALRAGHGFGTAVEGAVHEVEEPASSELRRASVEARLGRPMDQALLGVAERMESVDLTWVVNALAVQREVGGNLAEVLDNVARTLRARASVRRQVQALSAEGRLSANIISAMPFVMFLILTVISPDYIALLFERPLGRVLILVGLVLLAAGIFWLRRLVQPKF